MSQLQVTRNAYSTQRAPSAYVECPRATAARAAARSARTASPRRARRTAVTAMLSTMPLRSGRRSASASTQQQRRGGEQGRVRACAGGTPAPSTASASRGRATRTGRMALAAHHAVELDAARAATCSATNPRNASPPARASRTSSGTNSTPLAMRRPSDHEPTALAASGGGSDRVPGVGSSRAAQSDRPKRRSRPW